MTRLTVALFVALTLALGASTSASAQDVDCSQITGDEADAIFAADPSDPNNLDSDNDGDPCEDNGRSGRGAPVPAGSALGDGGRNPAAPGPAAAPAPAAARAVNTVSSTGVGPLDGNGMGGALVALLGLAGVSALAAVRTRRAGSPIVKRLD